MSRDGGRIRRPRGRDRSEDEIGGGGWSPAPDFGRPASRYPGSGPSAGFGGAPGQESQATVKWFKADKGFGFVEIEGGGGDAFLHASVLERAGARGVDPGAILRVRVGPGQKGLQVTEVLEITGGSAAPSAPPRSRDRYPPQPPQDGDGEEMQGTVKWYDSGKGFGFIAPADGGKDVFVHATALERSGLRGLSDGQPVRMRVVQGRKGPEVATIAVE